MGQFHTLRRRHVRLGGGGQHTDADGLGEQQHIPRLCPGVGQYPVGMDKARHCQTVLGLLVQDAVSPGDESPSLINLVVAAPQQIMDRLLGHIRRDSHDVQAQLRLAAHGIHVRQSIGGGDLPEQIGIIRDGREEIHRLYQGQVIGNLVDAGVVALVKAHQQIGVAVDLDAVQQLGQHACTHLGAAPGTLRQFRQLHFILSHCRSPRSPSFPPA